MGRRKTMVISFISGKSSVGKSTILSILAHILSEKFSTILIWDNDIFSPIQHILNGVEPNIKLIDVLTNNISISKALTKVTNRIFLIGGVNNYQVDIDLSDALKYKFEEIFVDNDFDIVLVDNHSGFSRIISNFCKLSDINLLFLTDEPISILDGYGLTKILYKFYSVQNIATVVNNVIDKEDGLNVANVFNQATNNFLGVHFNNISIIPYERDLKKFMFNLKDFVERTKDSEFMSSLYELSKTIQSINNV